MMQEGNKIENTHMENELRHQFDSQQSPRTFAFSCRSLSDLQCACGLLTMSLRFFYRSTVFFYFFLLCLLSIHNAGLPLTVSLTLLPPSLLMPSWVCPDCEYENEEEDAACAACEADRPANAGAAAAADGDGDDDYHHIHVGVILECEDAPNTKLKRLKVDVGAGEPIPVVTAATNVKAGDHVVVACVGAEVKGEAVAKTTVKGFPSQGMLCDAGMLGWVGGGAGAAVVLPASFAPGARPPTSRPRGDAA